MRSLLPTFLLTFISFSACAQSKNPPGIAPDSFGRAPVSKTYVDDNKLHAIGQNFALGTIQSGNFSLSSQYCETTRIPFTTKGTISRIMLDIPSKILNGTGAEINGYNKVFHYATLEYGANSNPPYFTQNGQTLMISDPLGLGFLTDPLGVSMPAATTAAIRYATCVAWPPSSPAVAAAAGNVVSGGSLSPNTTYYYEMTNVKSGVESGPTSEVSATTGATLTLSMSVSWAATVSPLGADSTNIYRATTSGAEAYLANVPNPGLNYVDTGSIPTVSGKTPPVAQKYGYTRHLDTGLSTTNGTAGSCNGTQALSVIGTGPLPIVGPAPALGSCLVATPDVIVADDVSTTTICGLGDSITGGLGGQGFAANANLSTQVLNWFTGGLPQGTFNSLNIGFPSTRISTLTNSGSVTGSAERMRLLDFCSYIISNLSVNDVGAGETWQAIAADQMQVAQGAYQRGKRYFVTTLTPYGTSTDNMLLQANFTPNANETTVRQPYNNWVRNGSLMTPAISLPGASISGTTLTTTNSPTLSVNQILAGPGVNGLGAPSPGTYIVSGSGNTWTVSVSQTAGAQNMTALAFPVLSGGMPSPYIAGYFDLAASVPEMNSSGVATPNGGYWPPGILISGSAGTFSGTPTLTSLPVAGGAYAVDAIAGEVVKITSGAASGQSCVISANSATTLTCNAASTILLTTAPAAGDAFVLYNTASLEGVHPTLYEYQIMSPTFSSWAATHFVGL
jgi:hypothetical protein